MTVDYGSAFYFLYPLSQIAIVIALYFILRKRSMRIKYWVLFAFFAFNLALHFFKVFFYPYNDPSYKSTSSLYTSHDAFLAFTLSPSNICAFNVMLFPFIYLTKKPVFKDYMFYVGIISGFSAVWLPSMGDFDTSHAIAFDTFRFYTCHGILWMMPLLMVALGVHKLNYHRIWQTPLIYLAVTAFVLVNNYTMCYVMNNTTKISDNGFVLAPPDSIADSAVGKFVLALVPSWFKPSESHSYYWPVAWQLFPVFIIGCPLAFLLALRWEGRHFLCDLKAIGAAICLKYRILRIGRKKCRYHKKYQSRNGKKYKKYKRE